MPRSCLMQELTIRGSSICCVLKMNRPMDLSHARNAHIGDALLHYAQRLPLPLPSQRLSHTYAGTTLSYGNAHAVSNYYSTLYCSHLAAVVRDVYGLLNAC
jgi:hypothetical protein